MIKPHKSEISHKELLHLQQLFLRVKTISYAEFVNFLLNHEFIRRK